MSLIPARFAPARCAVFATLAILAGCVGSPTPPRAVAPRVAPPRPVSPPPAPVAQAADWRDWPVTPGDWSYRVDARGSIALFGTPGVDALLTLRCDRQTNMVYLSRQGRASAPLTLRTSGLARSVTVQPTGGAPAYVATALTPRDPILDAMAFSRGRFLVEQSGMPTLVVPAWAEVGRVTEDCRR
ncbi:hypothetical protein [Sphingomonas glacialis]|uniref:Lipoprotein n=1 Tax=Sphingomonas glacialis TaxID=658225 RepID=A0A502FK87_9SPHN|nr:hypothetical protein [Sphingomonas glacialis]TPG49804.1 hypothetical protein EAH76_18190 [Sphingomonas glacialis]